MPKRGKKDNALVLLSAILFFLMMSVYVYAVGIPISELPLPVCGHEADSSIGYGQVIINELVYSCDNNADGVCPEEYQDGNNASLQGDCSSCLDPDCTGTLRGYVRDNTGRPVDRATVVTHPILWNVSSSSMETIATTDITGYYTMSAVSGTYYVSAAKESYDTELKESTVEHGQSTNLDFFLQDGTCHDDCTNSYGRCNVACNGLTFYNESSKCLFYDSTAMMLCNNRLRGTSVLYSGINDTAAYFIDCCEGAPEVKYHSKARVSANKIQNMIKTEKIARYNDVPVRVIIAYWTPVNE
jgi:hypothetical protein